jgi:hypothetical protein
MRINAPFAFKQASQIKQSEVARICVPDLDLVSRGVPSDERRDCPVAEHVEAKVSEGRISTGG